MTALLFCEGAPDTAQAALLDRLGRLDKRFASILLDASGDIARLYGAAPGTLYLLRPDLHIAGRWKTIAPDEVLHTARLCLGVPTP